MVLKWFRVLIAALLLIVATGSIYAQTDTPTPSPTPTPTSTPAVPQPNQSALLPVGSLIMWAGNSTPSGWLVADGSCISRTTYDTLFYVISTTFGVCDGSTTFAVPDMRGRVPVGAGTGTGLTARSVGQWFGEETHTLTEAQIPSHAHALFSSTGVALRVSNGATNNISGLNAATTTVNVGNFQALLTANAGSGQAHNIMQPSLAINFLIWTGTETLDIEAGTMPTNTPDPIRVDSTIEVAGTPQAVSFSYAATGGDMAIAILLFVSVGLQIIQLSFMALRGKK